MSNLDVNYFQNILVLKWENKSHNQLNILKQYSLLWGFVFVLNLTWKKQRSQHSFLESAANHAITGSYWYFLTTCSVLVVVLQNKALYLNKTHNLHSMPCLVFHRFLLRKHIRDGLRPIFPANVGETEGVLPETRGCWSVYYETRWRCFL